MTSNAPNSSSGDDNVNSSTFLSHRRGYYLRWSRLYKVVDTKKDQRGGGLLGGMSSIRPWPTTVTTASRMRHSIRNSASSTSITTSTTTISPAASACSSKKVILDQVSGYAAPGEVLACMGASGAGKTSLMDVLSGRSSYQGGVISINGEPISSSHAMKRLMSKVAYVKQADIFFAHLTVRDQLTYTALLRMPSSHTHAQKVHEVDRILSLLRLSRVADSPIRTLSGGEKKRVNIGTELLTDPLVLLLDEPTSGLDSTSAVALLQLLQSFARQLGKTIITSIHQPSSAVFSKSFDRLVMLSDGRVVYFGTPGDSLEYLRQHQLACPDGYNAADHWMDLLVTEDRTSVETNKDVDDDDDNKNNHNGKDGVTDCIADPSSAMECGGNDQASSPQRRQSGGPCTKVSPRLLLQQAWDGEAVAKQMDLELVSSSASATTTTNAQLTARHELELGNKYNTSWWTQFYVLTHRALKNSRSAIFTTLNLVKSLATGVVCGLLWYQTDYTEARVFDIRSYYFFTMTFWVFDSMFTALTAFPSERVVIMKERSSASYRLSAYFMAKTAADAPVRLTLPFLYMIVSFWMAGIDDRVSVFLGSIGCTLLSVLAGEALGLVVGAAIADLQKAMTAMTVYALFLMLLGGFFVQNIPPFISWAKYISPFKYAFDSSLQIVFDRDVPCDGSGALKNLCHPAVVTTSSFASSSRRYDGYASPAEVHNFIGIQGSLGFNIGMLLVLCFVPRYLAYLCLRMKKGHERS